MRPNKEFHNEPLNPPSAQVSPSKPTQTVVDSDVGTKKLRVIFKVDIKKNEVFELNFHAHHSFHPKIWSSWVYADEDMHDQPFYIAEKDIIIPNGYYTNKQAAYKAIE